MSFIHCRGKPKKAAEISSVGSSAKYYRISFQSCTSQSCVSGLFLLQVCKILITLRIVLSCTVEPRLTNASDSKHFG